jgi:glutamine amidotransferase
VRAALFDYGAGTLHSLAKALGHAGVEVAVETDPLRTTGADLVVLPGVGAFAPAAERLEPGLARLREAIEAGLPCVGICLGMQLLFERSEEGAGEGLGVFRGEVTRLRARRVPQIGWNTLEPGDDRLFATAPLDTAYFANGFVCRPADPSCVIAWCAHEGDRFAAAVRRGRVLGVQFHPEKSSSDGLRFLAACVAEVTRCA